MNTRAHDTSANTFDLASESIHRIANHLSMLVGIFRAHAQRLKHQQDAVPAAEVGMLLEGFGSKIEAMSRLHMRLAARDGDGAPIQVGDYLNELSAFLTDALPINGRVGLDLELDSGCAVTSDQALRVGLIVCELVTNATQHAHPTGIEGRVTVRCRRLGSELSIEIEDDGVGLPENFDPQTDGGPGMRTVRALAAQIGGAVRYRTSGLGLIAELRVPAASLVTPPPSV